MDSEKTSDLYDALPHGAQPIVGSPNKSQDPEDDMDVILFNNGEGAGRKVEKEKASGADLSNQLEKFRQQWHSELKNPQSSQNPRGQSNASTEPDSVEEQAKALYLQGMELEENHMLMEAIYYYKRALHLVPDIETRIAPLFAQSPRDRVRQDSETSLDGSEIEENLVAHLENLRVEDSSLCQPAYEQRAAHISALPVELMMYILQWVVSDNVDLRALEKISEVSRGFYLLARDEQIWKIACDRIWGVAVGSAKKYGGSWRKMMIERPHPHVDGCYISRMAYIRQGEQNMDQFYRPCHIVQYYRYMRFFADGSVMMLVSADEPIQTLPKLRHKSSRAAGIMVGGYRLKDSKVTCVMKRVKVEQSSNYRYKRQRRAAALQNETDVSFYAEFELQTSIKRPSAKLVWTKYTTCSFNKSTGEETVSNFELSKTSFPPMIFSYVNSFCTASEEPLV